MVWSAALAAALGVFGAASCTPISNGLDAEIASRSTEVSELLRYVRQTGGTGLMVVQGGEVLIDEAWPPPEHDPLFASFLYGRTGSGTLLEDVASQQKSFVGVLAAMAIDRSLLDVETPVSAYLGEGWSQASPEQERSIRVIDVLTMSSGLDEQFAYRAPPGTVFFYNTPVYAVTKRILEAASGQSLATITREWLTEPVGMVDTAWRERPAALASVGNRTGLVTTPQDVARFGQMILDGGVSQDGVRVVSRAQLNALFVPSATNPAYGRLWWLNDGAYSLRVTGRRDGPLIAAAPPDLLAALGAFDRRLYIVPSLGLVVVRTGGPTGESDFDEQFWLRLRAALHR